MQKINIFFILLLLISLVSNISAQTNNESTAALEISTHQTLTKEAVIAQMNYCTNALSNIINNKSMAVLDYESDQLINNLTMEQVGGIYQIQEYRTKLT